MKRTGVALVGLGPGARPHLASLADLRQRLDVRWAICRHPAGAELGPLAGTVSASSDLAAALADREVEVAIVATPASTHLEIAGRCLAAGKHTLVEKPLATALADAEQLVALATGSGRTLGVVLQHRFSPGALRLRELLAQDALGAVQAASVRVPWWRPQSYYDEPGRGTLQRDGGGVLLTQAIHSIDLFRSLVGVSAVQAAHATTTALHRMETEDHVTALLRLGNGAPGFLVASTAMFPGGPESIEVVGRLATAVLQAGALKVAFHDGRSEAVGSDGRSGSGANIMDFSHEGHRALIEDFLDATAAGRAPRVSATEALETHRLIETVLRTARAGADR